MSFKLDVRNILDLKAACRLCWTGTETMAAFAWNQTVNVFLFLYIYIYLTPILNLNQGAEATTGCNMFSQRKLVPVISPPGSQLIGS